jgi:hypothetical protein
MARLTRITTYFENNDQKLFDMLFWFASFCFIAALVEANLFGQPVVIPMLMVGVPTLILSVAGTCFAIQDYQKHWQ